jgi:hypothetical protein
MEKQYILKESRRCASKDIKLVLKYGKGGSES